MNCLLCRLKTTDAKAPICKNGACQICTTLIQVDEEINEAVATLRRLFSKRCGILSEHNRVHGLIQRLPVELKNQIFELLLPPQDEWGEIVETARIPSLLSYISMCKGWRDIALSNPFLWSKIHIDLRKPKSSRRINDWILRSQALPLTLHIQVDNRTVEPEPVLDVLSRCSNRLKSLSLHVPSSFLRRLQHDNFQYHHLTQLQIISSGLQFVQPLSLLNSTASPEKIELEGVSFRSLQISWNRLVSASIDDIDLEDFTQLFQHASQMTFCQISALKRGLDNFSMPPIIHDSLNTLDLYLSLDWDVAPGPLGSLTLPCLREAEISETIVLSQLPALVRRSSCPLTRLTLYQNEYMFSFDDLQPLPGVTDLVVESWTSEGDAMMRLLLEGYLPDLRHLTLHLQPFEVLWDIGVIPLLLDHKRPRPGGTNEGRLDKFIVVDRDRVSEFDRMWDSDVGEKFKLKELNVTMREDGFEFF